MGHLQEYRGQSRHRWVAAFTAAACAVVVAALWFQRPAENAPSARAPVNAVGEMPGGEPLAYSLDSVAATEVVLQADPASLQVTGIDPFHPLRPAIDESEALRSLFQEVRKEMKPTGCTRAVLVGHNSFFDLQFLNAAVERTGIKRNPFHPFSSFDTATLAGVAFGQTVLSRAVTAAGFEWQDEHAHSALYDAEMTARLFCTVVNRFRGVYGR